MIFRALMVHSYCCQYFSVSRCDFRSSSRSNFQSSLSFFNLSSLIIVGLITMYWNFSMVSTHVFWNLHKICVSIVGLLPRIGIVRWFQGWDAPDSCLRKKHNGPVIGYFLGCWSVLFNRILQSRNMTTFSLRYEYGLKAPSNFVLWKCQLARYRCCWRSMICGTSLRNQL